MPNQVYIPCPKCVGRKYAQLMPTGKINPVYQGRASEDPLILETQLRYYNISMKCNVCGETFALRIYKE